MSEVPTPTVSLATSFDERFPPENMISDDMSTFWLTTGMFPQEFILSFPQAVTMAGVVIQARNLYRLSIEYSSDDSASSGYNQVCTHEMQDRQGMIQHETIRLDRPTGKHIRVIIESGFEDFCAIHRVQVRGNVAAE